MSIDLEKKKPAPKRLRKEYDTKGLAESRRVAVSLVASGIIAFILVSLFFDPQMADSLKPLCLLAEIWGLCLLMTPRLY